MGEAAGGRDEFKRESLADFASPALHRLSKIIASQHTGNAA